MKSSEKKNWQMKNKMSLWAVIVSAGVLMSAAAGDPFETSKQLEVFTAVLQQVQVNYVDEIGAEQAVGSGRGGVENATSGREHPPRARLGRPRANRSPLSQWIAQAMHRRAAAGAGCSQRGWDDDPIRGHTHNKTEPRSMGLEATRLLV